MKFGIKEVMDITLFDLTTGEPALYLDTLKISNMEEVAETVYAVGGKGGSKLIGWDSSREVTFEIEDALASMESLSIFFGGTLSEGEQTISTREVLTAVESGTDATITVAETPIEGSIYVYDSTGTVVPVDYATDVTGLTIIVGLAADAGEEFTIYYDFLASTNVESFTITSNNFPGTYKMVGSSVVRNENGVDIPFQVVVPKLKVMPGMSLTFEAEGDPSVFGMTWEALKDPAEDVLVKVIKYGA